MQTVCRTMGLARSHVRYLLRRDDGLTHGRSHHTPSDDEELLAELGQEIAQLPSYGYRRAYALVLQSQLESFCIAAAGPPSNSLTRDLADYRDRNAPP